MRDAAGKAGAAAADAWAHTHLHHRTAIGATGEAARAALARLEAGADPDDMPAPVIATASVVAACATAGLAASDVDDSPQVAQVALLAAYRDTYTAVRRRHAIAHCRLALAEPAPAGRDWSHLDRDRVGPGAVGVFAGDWAWHRTPEGVDRIRVGFVGVFIDTWNGWAVFACTRAVAEAIAADQGRMRADWYAAELAAGRTTADAAALVDASMAALWFDGDTLIVDERATSGDPNAVERSTAADDGTWVVMGWSWCWTVVEPGDCDTIVGELPSPERQQQDVVLDHVDGVRVPHDRLRVTGRRDVPDIPQLSVYQLCDGDNPIAAVVINRYLPSAQVWANGADAEAALRDFAAQCRRHTDAISVPEVIDALIQQYHLDEHVRAADPARHVVVRLLDSDGHVERVQTVAARSGRRRDALDGIVRHRAESRDGRRWEWWTGHAWTPIPGTAHRQEA